LSEFFYGRFYGFDSPPFHITPDPSLLFATDTHQQALGAIEYGIAAGKGFIAITGEVGVGKTTVLRICLDRLDTSKTKVIYLFNPALSVPELYATILEELDVLLQAGQNPGDTLRMLQRALLATHEAGTQVILAVDEAQNMPEQTLESLRILSNLETATSKLLQIILVGQPELEALLAKHSLRQLAQRVAVRSRIEPLTFRQSCRYIQHRSHCAGRMANRPLFTAPALWYLSFAAQGIPRTINILCDNALINGYGDEAERISLRIAYQSRRALKSSPSFRRSFRRTAMFATVAVLFVAIVFSSGVLLRRVLEPPTARASAAPAVAAAPRPSQTEPPARSLEPSSAPAAPIQGDSIAAQAVLPAEPDTAAEAPAAATEPPPSQTAAPAMTPAAAPAPPPSQAAAPATTPAAAPAPPPTHAAAPEAAAPAAARTDVASTDKQHALKWFVRKGDTVYKVCRATYGQCDEQALRAVFAYNPQIGSNALIRQGEIILMPERVRPNQSN